MSVVDIEDLRNYMSGIRLPPAALQIIPTILDARQGDIEAFLGYSIEPGQDPLTETIGLSREGYFETSFWPVASVTGILDSTGAAFTTWRFQPDGDFKVIGNGPWDPQGYTVTYVPGLPPRPFAVAKGKILYAASREVAGMHDDSRGNTRSTQGGSTPTPVVGFQKGELRSLSRWRSRSGAVYSRTRDYSGGVAVNYGPGDYTPGGAEIGGVVSLTTAPFFEGDATIEGA